jgi:hypothetical protein
MPINNTIGINDADKVIFMKRHEIVNDIHKCQHLHKTFASLTSHAHPTISNELLATAERVLAIVSLNGIAATGITSSLRAVPYHFYSVS